MWLSQKDEFVNVDQIVLIVLWSGHAEIHTVDGRTIDFEHIEHGGEVSVLHTGQVLSCLARSLGQDHLWTKQEHYSGE